MNCRIFAKLEKLMPADNCIEIQLLSGFVPYVIAFNSVFFTSGLCK